MDPPPQKRARTTTDNELNAPATAVPSTAAWYRADACSDIERRALPEYFNNSSQTKTPKALMHMRNQIISLYREQPGLHLSVTECRRHLAADVGAVMRLHQFLEHWGLINYNASPSCDAASAARGSVVFDGPTASAVSAAAAAAGAIAGTALPLRPAIASGGGEWMPQETLSLLDALEQSGESSSWDEVATAVGRSVEECIGHFLALPIEEPYALESLGATTSAAAASGGEAAAATDPVLFQLKLLAAATGAPSLAAGASSTPNGEASDSGGSSSGVDAAAAALRASARECVQSLQARASQIEEEEGKLMVSLLTTAVDTQLRRMELKVIQLDELQTIVQREKEQLERMRHQIYAERIAIDQRRASTAPPPLPWVAVQLQPHEAAKEAAAPAAPPPNSHGADGVAAGTAPMEAS